MMDRHELIDRLKVSAMHSLRLAGDIPESVRGIAVSWAFEPDPNDKRGRDGLRITWHTYFDSAPGEAEAEFADCCSDHLIADLWSRIVRVEHENKVAVCVPELAPASSEWLFLRQSHEA